MDDNNGKISLTDKKRESNHVRLMEAIDQLESAKNVLAGVLAEITGAGNDKADKGPTTAPPLAEVLYVTPDRIIGIADQIQALSRTIRKVLFFEP